MRQDKWYVNLYGSNEGRVYVGPLGATCGVAEVHTTAGREQALRDAETIVDAVNSVDELREQNQVLREALQEIYEGRWTPGISCCYEDDARDIYPTREMRIRNIALTALTATSQPGGTHEL